MLTLERFAVELHEFSGSLSRHDRRAAQRCLADAIACAASGVDTEAHRNSVAAFGESACAAPGRGSRRSTVWFTGGTASPMTAAYLNSVAVSAHDLDDGNRAAVGHPAGAVIPAVLAEIEAAGSDVDPLDAIVVGYEAGVRLAVQRDTNGLPTMATGRWAGFASAAASCHAAGDDPPTIAAALAHAGALAPQLAPPDPRGADGLKEGTPWGVYGGLLAARLARAGVPAPTYLLERHPDFDPAGLSSMHVGATAAIHDTYFKRYACCRWIHPAIDALLDMHGERPFVIDDIERIEIGTFSRSLTLSNVIDPATIEEAHYSFPFCVSLALTAGRDALLPIEPATLRSSAALALARRVALAVDPAFDSAFPASTPATVRVVERGAVRERSVPTAAGDPALAFTAEIARDKERRLFRALPNRRELALALHATPLGLSALLDQLKKVPIPT